MTNLITDHHKEWLYWAEFFVRLWPELMIDELAEMADRMLNTFS